MAHDLLIKTGLLVDGTGAPARRADVAITGGRIAEIGRVVNGVVTWADGKLTGAAAGQVLRS
jgi:N-acyl-D-aspartate/D-glutamate deacylase